MGDTIIEQVTEVEPYAIPVADAADLTKVSRQLHEAHLDAVKMARQVVHGWGASNSLCQSHFGPWFSRLASMADLSQAAGSPLLTLAFFPPWVTRGEHDDEQFEFASDDSFLLNDYRSWPKVRANVKWRSEPIRMIMDDDEDEDWLD